MTSVFGPSVHSPGVERVLGRSGHPRLKDKRPETRLRRKRGRRFGGTDN